MQEVYSFPTYCLSMASTNPITIAGSSPQKPVDDQKKITENELPTTATTPIDDLLKTALGGKKLEKLSATELDEFLDRDLLG